MPCKERLATPGPVQCMHLSNANRQCLDHHTSAAVEVQPLTEGPGCTSTTPPCQKLQRQSACSRPAWPVLYSASCVHCCERIVHALYAAAAACSCNVLLLLAAAAMSLEARGPAMRSSPSHVSNASGAGDRRVNKASLRQCHALRVSPAQSHIQRQW